MTVWMTIPIVIWLFFIQHFMAAALTGIYTTDPYAEQGPAKFVALVVGIFWPVVLLIFFGGLIIGYIAKVFSR